MAYENAQADGDAFHWIMIRCGVEWFIQKYGAQVVVGLGLLALAIHVLSDQ